MDRPFIDTFRDTSLPGTPFRPSIDGAAWREGSRSRILPASMLFPLVKLISVIGESDVPVPSILLDAVLVSRLSCGGASNEKPEPVGSCGREGGPESSWFWF